MPPIDDETRLTTSDETTILSNLGGRSSSNDATVLSGSVSSSWPVSTGPRLEPGQTFGPYTITKLLGHGGMGEVYEAVHVETSRRVALKLLRGMMNQFEDRARFLREGRLAASISHPHTVYIFGSEEIDDMPVISMQLLPGGTLKDRIVDKGPMAPAEAVAAILNVIGGLDAAASAGILHRDIKPSNCFVDVDGSVKVGDFGLSISTSARDGSGATKGFQGTPQYAPPEQLRGDALDVRADIYAVGATLFYLLTGRAPFDSRDFQTLIDQVKNAPPPLAHKVRPGIPPALSALIARCLSKEPDGRPASYAELAKALRPFSGASRPARRGIRFVAGALDSIFVGIPVAILKSALMTGGGAKLAANVSVDPWTALFALAYFALFEGLWHTTPGKRLCGLRVISTTGDMNLRLGAARSFIFQAPQLPLVIVALMFGSQRVAEYLGSTPWLAGLASMGPTTLSILLFSTMRRKNGLAAVHDLLTGTRVVTRRVDEFRAATAMTIDLASAIDAGAPAAATSAKFGPFDVGRLIRDVPGGRLFDGVDTMLKRRVWLIESDPGAPETPRARRDVDRVGRLHWLAGRRSANENWDAFEAPQGAPLDVTPGASDWTAVHGWLNDLVAELAAAERDGSMPALSLDRVWIRHDGRAVLLDVPCQSATGDAEMRPALFLASIGRLAKAGGSTPVSAMTLIDRWAKKHGTLSIADAEHELASLSTSLDRVTRGKRLLPVLASAAPVALMLFSTIIAVRSVNQKLSSRQFALLAILDEARDETDARRKQAFETYAAGAYHAELNDASLFSAIDDKDKKDTKDTQDSRDDADVARLREIATRAAALTPTADETAAAAYLVQPALDKIERKKDVSSAAKIFVILVFVGCGLSFFGALISVLVRPSGILMSAIGLAVATRTGREISRVRAVFRLLIAWSPMIVFTALAIVPATQAAMMEHMLPAGIALGAMAVGTVWTILRPTLGPHDIAARTTIGVR